MHPDTPCTPQKGAGAYSNPTTIAWYTVYTCTLVLEYIYCHIGWLRYQNVYTMHWHAFDTGNWWHLMGCAHSFCIKIMDLQWWVLACSGCRIKGPLRTGILGVGSMDCLTTTQGQCCPSLLKTIFGVQHLWPWGTAVGGQSAGVGGSSTLTAGWRSRLRQPPCSHQLH